MGKSELLKFDLIGCGRTIDTAATETSATATDEAAQELTPLEQLEAVNELAQKLAAMVKAITEQAYKFDAAEGAGKDPEREKIILLSLLNVAEPIADEIINADV